MKHVLLFEKFGIIDSVVAKTDEAFKDLSSALIDISNTEYESKTIMLNLRHLVHINVNFFLNT